MAALLQAMNSGCETTAGIAEMLPIRAIPTNMIEPRQK
jgi:hypothetical protein